MHLGGLQLFGNNQRRVSVIPEVVNQVAIDCYPHTLCNYLYELSSLFMSFYEHCPILKSEVEPETAQSRLQLCAYSAAILQQGLDLLGIEVMERM